MSVAQLRTPITRPFARIDGLPVAVMIVAPLLAMAAAFTAVFPGIALVVYSGIRTYAEQEAIFRERYVTAANINGRRVYDARWWQGVLWYRISPAGTVAAPGSSNHETGRSLDLRDTGADPGVSASFATARNRWLSENCHRWGFTHTGKNFGEPWHFEQLQVADPCGGMGKPAAISPTDPGQPFTTAAGTTTGGGGSAAAFLEGINNMAEAYVKAPNGTIAHLRPGGKTNFKNPKHYADHQATVKKLIAGHATDLIKPPLIDDVPALTWAQFELACDAIGAPKD